MLISLSFSCCPCSLSRSVSLLIYTLALSPALNPAPAATPTLSLTLTHELTCTSTLAVTHALTFTLSLSLTLTLTLTLTPFSLHILPLSLVLCMHGHLTHTECMLCLPICCSRLYGCSMAKLEHLRGSVV